MAETPVKKGALAGLLKSGRNSARNTKPGLIITELPDVVQIQLIARSGQEQKLVSAIARFLGRSAPLLPLEGAERNGLFICATGPRDYWVFAERRSSPEVIRAIEAISDGLASVFDQSDGRLVLRVSGSKAVDLLAKGSPLDLCGPSLPAACGIHTVIEQIPALVVRHNASTIYDLSVPRSYAGSFAIWLYEAMNEYEYMVEEA